MTINELQAIPQTQEALYINAQAVKIKRYLDGRHDVLNRKDFTFKEQTFHTAKILLQVIKSIVDFHCSYLVGNPVTLTGDAQAVSLFNGIYDRANYTLTDYQIVNDLVCYGNAYEYVYLDDGGIIKSKVFDPLDSFPVYTDRGEYVAFLEHWRDAITGNEFYNLFEPDTVTEYSTETTGTLKECSSYKNLTGLPIHYTSGVKGPYSSFGEGVVADLIPIVDELEALLSKASDAVTTLSLNPLGVSAGQRIDSQIDRNITGVILNLEDGGQFTYATATVDYNTVSLIMNQLINQLYSVAQVPSVVFNGNVSNVSEVSLKLLFTQLDNKAKRQAAFLRDGFYKRWDAMRRLFNTELTEEQYNSLDVSFNFNTPTDSSATLSDLLKQYEAGAMSKKTLIELSPYTTNAEAEMAQIEAEAREAADKT